MRKEHYILGLVLVGTLLLIFNLLPNKREAMQNELDRVNNRIENTSGHLDKLKIKRAKYETKQNKLDKDGDIDEKKIAELLIKKEGLEQYLGLMPEVVQPIKSINKTGLNLTGVWLGDIDM